MTIQEERYIKQFQKIKIKQIGKLIDEGMGNRVYEYGKKQVLKIPKISFIYHPPSLPHAKSDLQIINRYFKDYIQDTEIITTPKSDYYCIIQERITNPRHPTKNDVALLQDQFDDIVKKNIRLYDRHGDSLDFLGQQGLRECIYSLVVPWKKPHLFNIVISENKSSERLVILDIELLRMKERDQTLRDLRFRFVSTISYFLNIFFLRYCFGIHIKNNSAEF
ncbi:MAG: hypothetical protein WCO06_02095 [Candidatus Roizmanbacteria bacterium]